MSCLTADVWLFSSNARLVSALTSDLLLSLELTLHWGSRTIVPCVCARARACVCVMIISAHSASSDVSELSLLWCTTALHYGCLSFCHLWDLSDLLIASFQRSAEQNQELKPVAPSASPVAVCIHVIEVNSRAVCVQLTHTGIVNWLNSVQTKFFGLFLQ